MKETYRYGSAGNSAVLQLDQGDRVWVERMFFGLVTMHLFRLAPDFI